MLFLIGIRKKKSAMKAREIRRKYGVIAQTNVTDIEINEGIERQWRRYNDVNFHQEEQLERIDRVIGVKRT